MLSKFILYAPNVHTGGGFVLLQDFLDAWPQERCLVAWLDFRVKNSLRLPSNNIIYWVKPSVISRLRAEIELAVKCNVDSNIFCFHGIPPVLAKSSKIKVFQQNRNLLGVVPTKAFGWKTRQRIRIEMLISWLFRTRVGCYIVQTPSMAEELKRWYGSNPVDIRILPFAKIENKVFNDKCLKWDFIYISDGESHKNHRRLVKAWVILASLGLKPSLALTLTSRDASLAAWIQRQIEQYNLQITDLGMLAHKDVLELYGNAKALIFPSVSESFGLPLIEARQAGVPILASELDFVRDVCVPRETFDPFSSVSIARAVRRFLGQAELPVMLISPDNFMRELIKES